MSLFVERIRARQRGGATQPPLVVLAGGPGQSATDAFGAVGAERALPGLLEARRDHLRPARHGSLRAPALPPAGAGEPVRRRARRRARAPASSVRGAPSTRRATPTTTSTRSARRSAPSGSPSAGTSYGTKVALSYALRYPRPRRAARARLGGAPRRPGSVLPRQYGGRAACAPLAVRARVRVDHRPGGRPGPAGPADRRPRRRSPRRASWTRAAGAGAAGSRAWTSSRSCSPATSTPPCGRPSPARSRRRCGGDVTPMLRLRRRAIEIDAEPPPPRAAQLRRVRRHDVRGDPDAVAARHAARRGRAAPARRGGRGHHSRIPRSSHSTAPRRSRATRSSCARAGRPRPVAPDLGSGPVPGRARAAASRAPTTSARRSENAQQAAQPFPRAQARGRARHRPLRHRRRLLRLRAARVRALHPAPAGGERLPAQRRTRSRPSRRRRGGSAPSGRCAARPGNRGRTLAAMKLTLRDVAEDSLTALVFGPGETDRARGGGLRAGHYGSARTTRSSCTAWRIVPGVTVTGRIERFLERRKSGRLRIGGRAARARRAQDRALPHHRAPRRAPRARGPQGTGSGCARRARGSRTPPLPRLRERARRLWLF